MFNLIPEIKALATFIISITFAGITWFTPARIETGTKAITCIVSVVTGVFAIRHYINLDKDRKEKKALKNKADE